MSDAPRTSGRPMHPAPPLLASYHVSADEGARELGGTLAAGRRFPIASVSKTLTALLVARLAVAGALSWFGPVPGVGRPISWRTLLGHGAGVPLELLPAHWRTSALTPAELSAALPALPDLDLPPGTWHYSNLGYGVAARALESETGQAYADLLGEHLLVPLGMTSTSFPGPAEPAGVLGEAAAAGDMRSTLDDLVTLGQALAGLRPEVVPWSVLALLLDTLVPSGRGELLGAGVRTCRIGMHQVLVSSGTLLDHTTCLVAWPRRGTSVFVAAGAADHAVLRDLATARWLRDEQDRRWWWDGQEVHELRHGSEVELVLRETTWPYPLFAGRRDGDVLTGIDWQGRAVTLTDHDRTLTGPGIALTADLGDSAWSSKAPR